MKKLVDVVTVLLLAAAFIFAYVTGFVKKDMFGEPALATSTLAIISIAGMVVLFVVGCVSSLISRIKREIVTKSFIALFVLQMVSVVGMITIMLFVLLKMYTVDNPVIRFLYIVFAMAGVIGYCDSVIYSDCVARLDEEDEEEEEFGGEDGTDEDSDEEECDGTNEEESDDED